MEYRKIYYFSISTSKFHFNSVCYISLQLFATFAGIFSVKSAHTKRFVWWCIEAQNLNVIGLESVSDCSHFTPSSLSLCFSHGVSTKRDYSPVSWSEYFDMMDDVVIGSGETKDISFTHTSESALCVYNSRRVYDCFSLTAVCVTCFVCIKAVRTVHCWFCFTEEDTRPCPGLFLRYKHALITNYILV